MNAQQLRSKIKKLKNAAPITAQFEHRLSLKKMWNYKREKYKYNNDQQEHWVGWLGPNSYRRGEKYSEAKAEYNLIKCPPMILWLGETSGVSKLKLESAVEKALSIKFKTQSLSVIFALQCRIIREVIPWEDVEKKLLNK